ncbi:uncharacterized protein LOC143022578 [Oratosquilla oratoria]|uniref:uncharacterized protein LOC143022578 n=1 Tax=Oratosquilla oratoria TaxID=337810 RepID=UPI003F771A2F
MRAVPLLTLGLFFCQLYGSYSLSCQSCKPKECRPVSYENCHAGVVLDTCGCCLVCAKGDGKQCGGHFKILGSCSKGFICVPNPNDVNPPEHAEGTCQFIASTKAKAFLKNKWATSKKTLTDQIPESTLSNVQNENKKALSDTANVPQEVPTTNTDPQSSLGKMYNDEPRSVYATPKKFHVRNMQPIVQPKRYFISYNPQVQRSSPLRRHNNPSKPRWNKNAYRRQRFVRKPKRNGSRKLVYYN